MRDMIHRIARREVLKALGAAGAGAVLRNPIASAQPEAIRVAGKAVEVAITAVSPHTVRLSLLAVDNGKPQAIPSDGSLVQQNWPPVARLTTVAKEEIVRCGEL